MFRFLGNIPLNIQTAMGTHHSTASGLYSPPIRRAGCRLLRGPAVFEKSHRDIRNAA
jgi:hypothetical protein